jgi:amino acid transporter
MPASQQLKREITSIHLLFISFSAIFGSGWLFAPLYAARIAGPSALLAWILGGLISAVIGITMAEVITLFPKSGGLNNAAGQTHGAFLALTVTLLNLIVFLILPALEVRAIIQYVSGHIPSLLGADDRLTPLGFLVSAFLLASILGLNLMGAKLTSRANSLLCLFKIVTPLLICFSFLLALKTGNRLNHSNLTHMTHFDWAAIFQAIATSGIIFSFNGFNQATVFAGEAENPKKTIPFAIFGSLALAGALYLLVQYVFLISIPPENIQGGWAALSFVGDQGPFAGLAKILGLSWILVVIYGDAILSPAGTAFSYASAAPRLFYSLAETTESFPFLRKVNSNGAPYFSILVAFVLELLAFYFLPSLKAMIAILVAAFVSCYTVVPVSLLFLRKTQPTLQRPFKIRFAPLLCYLSVFFSNLMVFSCGWGALRNLIITASAILLVCFLSLKKKGLGSMNAIRGSEWFILQLISMSVLGYLKEMGTITFEMGALSVATLSLGLLMLALKTGKN